MEFWKNHTGLKIVVITILFAVGLSLVATGWKMTGELTGLVIMLAGVLFLLVALLIYNKPFEERKIKK